MTAQLGFTFEEKPSRRIWPVRDLVEQARQLVERQFFDVWVEGEISNFRPAPSGHIYFSLKDADAQLPIVLFRRQASLLRFRPEDGLHVLVRGRVSIYEQRGQLQVVAETMEPVGAGSLQLAFEQLKERLKAEGLFEAARKRPLPAFPRTVGIVTSPTGAVVRDFLNIVGRRHSGLNVLLWPVSVQGDSAAAEIETAIAQLNESGLVDLVVVARGGGSLEDMAAFNSERVARAISGSRVPVVSAVGHETDFTIADFAADLRAPTPSAAAELVTEAQHKVIERVNGLGVRLERAARFQLLHARQRVDSLHAERGEWHLQRQLSRLEQRTDECVLRLEKQMTERLRTDQRLVAELGARILRHDPRRMAAETRERVVSLQARVERATERSLRELGNRLHGAEARLHALSPLEVLQRGYAIVQDAHGVVIRSAGQITEGDRVRTRLGDGAFVSRVVEEPVDRRPE
ncbi:MAG TPA: exodeoxyribonuclease VII large subunit [Terracidiphilus sp.]|nr:exodeoxyribonuclease VII large subunit [Terracidiphilus sp.]